MMRPYYHRFAWAYDLLNAEPITWRIDFIVAQLRQRGVRPPDRLLDAGCGAGRYSIDLAACGFTVLGVDRSPELVKIAMTKSNARTIAVEFSVADLLEFDAPDQFRAVLCRGVLNDITQDLERKRIFSRFAQWLSPGGVVIFDVRDWTKTVARYEANSASKQEIQLADGGVLVFASQTSLDYAAQCLRVREMFEHRRSAGSEFAENEFSMRCWSRNEISECMAGRFEDTAFYSTYGEKDAAWKDRLVVIATRAAAQKRQAAKTRNAKRS
jgi:ubiquinone/menaquinone biosynthesis C-methylase UbiE